MNEEQQSDLRRTIISLQSLVCVHSDRVVQRLDQLERAVRDLLAKEARHGDN